MNVRYKEDPRSWRNSALFALVPLLVLAALLFWRHILSRDLWLAMTLTLLLLGVLACVRPSLFRGFYRASTWAGFWSSQTVARVFLVLIFVAIIIPAGILLRLLGKDPLKLKHSRNSTSYWRAASSNSPLDRLF